MVLSVSKKLSALLRRRQNRLGIFIARVAFICLEQKIYLNNIKSIVMPSKDTKILDFNK